jgi:flagellar motor switch protein FliM
MQPDPQPAPALSEEPALPADAPVLSPAEVDQLLTQVSDDSGQAGEEQADPSALLRSATVQPYNFRQPSFLTTGELRRLRLRHEGFARSLAARLSIYLRLDFGLEITQLQTLPFASFCARLTDPTQIALFKVEPLPGLCLIELRPRLGLTIVDRLMGGPARDVNAEREITDIEQALLDQVTQIILVEWCGHWAKTQDLRPFLIGHENSGRFLQSASADTVMLVLSLEARVGDCTEPLQLAVPSQSLEPLIRALSREVEPPTPTPAAPPPPAPAWKAKLNDIRVPVSAEWSDLEMTARELAALKPGDLLRLDPRAFGRVTVRLGGLPRFHGRLGTQARRWAIELDQPTLP